MTPVHHQYSPRTLPSQNRLTTGRAGTSVTSLLGLLVATLAEVISASVDNQGTLREVSKIEEQHEVETYTQNTLSTDQLDELVLHVTGGIALSIGLEVAQVTDVTIGIGGSTVGLAEGVD